jgi:hypothetical protein
MRYCLGRFFIYSWLSFFRRLRGVVALNTGVWAELTEFCRIEENAVGGMLLENFQLVGV